MLQKNPLSPPRPLRDAASSNARADAQRQRQAFVSAEDFDATGILAGVDPCESRYWWLPDLVACGTDRAASQATSRPLPAAAADA